MRGLRWIRPDLKTACASGRLHSALHNASERTLRLSCDIRWQPASDPFDDRWMGAVGEIASHKARKQATIELADALRKWGLQAAL